MRLNVGLFNDSFPPTIDGVSNTVVNYAEYITKNHGKCTVATPKYPHVIDDYPFEVYRYSSADISKRIGYRVGNTLSVRTIRALYAKQFDIMHVHSPFASAIIANEIKRICPSIPVVFTYHTKFEEDFKARLKLPALCTAATKLVAHNIKQADEVWVVSEGAAESLRNIGYKGSYRVMKNGTDFKKGKADESAVKELKSKHGIADDETVFLFVGRMMWYKNVGLILDAIKRLPNELKYKMIFVGEGADRAAVESYAEQLGLKDNVIFTGAITDRETVRTYFSASDLFLFPSTYDTAGLVVMEAAAVDLPSVLIDGSCAAEDVVDDFSGFLCEENPKSMAEKIVKALEDKEHLKAVGKNAGKYVYLSWEDSVARAYKRYCEIYNAYMSGVPKKSIFQKAMPSNIKSSVVSGVNKSKVAAKNATKSAYNRAEKIKNGIVDKMDSAVSSTKSGTKTIWEFVQKQNKHK